MALLRFLKTCLANLAWAVFAVAAWLLLFWAIYTFWIALVFMVGVVTVAFCLFTVAYVLFRGVN